MSSKTTVLEVAGISKAYHVYTDPKERLKQMIDRKKRYTEFWALRSVSFSVTQGETVGLVGRNGSGKSTLLQIIAGTVTPSAGHVNKTGRVVALLELGSGFNPEFTGVENVYLNGAMLGISKKEMDKRLPIIKEFADIGDFINQPVKTYSSGMFARLAFAVAINMDPDILIVDEILAVGDIAFQAKCVSKLRKMKDEGLTLLFVSHSVDALKSLCNRAILLERGELTADGTSEEVTNRYLASIRDEMNKQSMHKDLLDVPGNSRSGKSDSSLGQLRYGSREVYFEAVDMIDEDGQIVIAYEYGQRATLRCRVRAARYFNKLNVSFLVRDITGVDLFGTTVFDERQPLFTLQENEGCNVNFEFPILLRGGSYSVSVAVNTVSALDYSDVYLFEQIDAATSFQVIANPLRPVHYKFHVPVVIRQSSQGEC